MRDYNLWIMDYELFVLKEGREGRKLSILILSQHIGN